MKHMKKLLALNLALILLLTMVTPGAMATYILSLTAGWGNQVEGSFSPDETGYYQYTGLIYTSATMLRLYEQGTNVGPKPNVSLTRFGSEMSCYADLMVAYLESDKTYVGYYEEDGGHVELAKNCYFLKIDSPTEIALSTTYPYEGKNKSKYTVAYDGQTAVPEEVTLAYDFFTYTPESEGVYSVPINTTIVGAKYIGTFGDKRYCSLTAGTEYPIFHFGPEAMLLSAENENILFYEVLDETEKTAKLVDTYSGIQAVSIPEKVSIGGIEYTVTSIGCAAFSGCTELTSVTIPKSVTNIENYAFYGCRSLTNATIGDGVTNIGRYAFDTCGKLTNVTIGRSVESIEEGAFQNCGALTGELTIPDSVKNIGDTAFADCYALTKVTIGRGVESIGAAAFSGCRALSGELTIPDSVKSVGASAFDGCALTCVTIGSGVTDIGVGAFGGGSVLTSFKVKEGNTAYQDMDGVLFNSGGTVLLQCPREKEGEYVIPDSVTSIECGAFANCQRLKGVTIPANVTSIGIRAFSGCDGLTGVTIPDSVTSIGREAFYGCRFLTSVTIPDGVPRIEDQTFSECSRLQNVTIGNGVTSIGSMTFSECSDLTCFAVKAENAAYMAVDGVLLNKEGTTLIQCPAGKKGTYTIPDSVTHIGYLAFQDCQDLTNITIFARDVELGSLVFYKCSKNLVVQGYTGSTTETYCKENNITFRPLDDTPDPAQTPLTVAMFTVDTLDATYTGQPVTKTITGKDGDKTLAENTDYTVAYANNTNAGTATITITGIGNYTGTVTKTFTILPSPLVGTVTVKLTGDQDNNGQTNVGDTVTAEISGAPAGLSLTYQWYNSGVAIPGATGQTYTVREGDVALTVSATASGNYAGTLTSTMMEVGKTVLTGEPEIKNESGEEPKVNDILTLDKIGDKTLVEENGVIKLIDGDTVIIVVILWLRDGEPIEGANGLRYTLTKADQGKTITAQIKPQDTDNYTGTLAANISVPPAKPDRPSGSASSGNGQLTVTWAAPADNGAPITGYIVYLENGQRVELGPDVTSHTFTGLTNGTKYVIIVIAVNAAGESTELRMEGTPSGGSGGGGNSGSGSSSGGGGGGSSTSSASNAISTAKASNGSASLSTKNAKKGDTVTVTVRPDQGYKLESLTVKDKNGKVVTVTDIEDGKYTFVMPATVVTVTPVFAKETPPAETPPETQPKTEPSVSVTVQFGDVKETSWFRDAAQYVYDRGIMNGLTSDTFGPDAYASRAMIVTILYRLEGEPAVSGGGFSDVDSNKYYSNAVSWASANGIVNGFEDSTFRPDGAVTREQLAVMLFRYGSYKGQNMKGRANLSYFRDVEQISKYALDALSWANAEGLISGTDWGGLYPGGNATRAETAAILMRYCENGQ